MSRIEAIIVNGVRYDKIKAQTEFVCEECDLQWLCEPIGSTFPVSECKVLAESNECWKRVR